MAERHVMVRIFVEMLEEHTSTAELRLFLSNRAGSSSLFLLDFPNPEIPIAAKTSMSAISS